MRLLFLGLAIASAYLAAPRNIGHARPEKGRVPTSPVHEALVALFRNRPSLAAELVRDLLGLALPVFTMASVRNAERTEAPVASYRADVVVELAGPTGVVAAVVVEVQLERHDDKLLTWPLYVASVRRELRCPTVLLVVAPDPRVARWARRPIGLGHPGFALEPIVLGSPEIPIVIDRAVAIADPELAVLSALAHGKGQRGYEIAIASLAAVARIDEERSNYYTRVVLAAVSEAARRRLEEEMRLDNWPEPTDLEKRILARGRTEGSLRAKAEGLLTVLTGRAIPIAEVVRARILACTDTAELDRWLARSGVVTRAEELFDGAAD